MNPLAAFALGVVIGTVATCCLVLFFVSCIDKYFDYR